MKGRRSRERGKEVGLWDGENLQKEGVQKDNSGGTRKIGQDEQDGQDELGQKRDDHLGLWVCGFVGLWDSCGRLNDPYLRGGLWVL